MQAITWSYVYYIGFRISKNALSKMAGTFALSNALATIAQPANVSSGSGRWFGISLLPVCVWRVIQLRRKLALVERELWNYNRRLEGSCGFGSNDRP